MPKHLRIPVNALERGDILWPTNREVVRCSRGISTPPRKHDVDLRRAEPEGNDENPVIRSTFGSHTVVSVIRNDGASYRPSQRDEARYRRSQRAARRMGMGPLRYR